MNIKVLFFAACREIAGTSQMQFELPEGELVSSLLKKLQSDYPDFQAMPLLLAVNAEYVQPDYRLRDGDVVALIPLVSGG